MKILLITIMSVLLSCGGLISYIPKKPTSVEHLVDRTGLVEIICDDVFMGHGSAAYISDNVAVTAAHVVDSEGCKYLLNGVETQVLSSDKELDIAYLSTAKKIAPALIREPALGERIICLGFPRQYFRTEKPLLSVTYGAISTLGLPNGLVRISANVNSGSSGGVCWASKDGAALGIMVSIHQQLGAPIVGYSYLRSLL